MGEPFRGSHAVRAGAVSRQRLRSGYARVLPDVYVPAGTQLTALLKAKSAWCWSDGGGVLAGWSAAAMLGVRWISDDLPAAVNLPGHVRAHRELTIYRDELADSDWCERGGYRVTTPARTAFDLGRRLPLERAVEALDAIYQATRLRPAQVSDLCAAHPGARGCRRLRRAVDLSDSGAESPWETRTRLALVRAGLPRPETQATVYDETGEFVARVDLAYRRQRVAIEYDGGHHFETEAQRDRDVTRWNSLEAAGWRVVRVRRPQLQRDPELLIGQIRALGVPASGT